MKILQICNKAPYPPNDGSSIAICSLTEGLIDSGNELHLLTINTKKHFKSDENIPVEFKTKAHYQSVYKNTSISLIGFIANLFSKQSYFVSRFFFKSFEVELIKKITETSFDIIQLEGAFMGSYIPSIRKHSKAKIVLRAHNVEHQIWDRHIAIEKNAFKKWYLKIQNNRLKAFEMNVYHSVDSIITITDEDKINILKIIPNKSIYTAVTGLDLKKYKPVKEVKEPDSIFHFASMDWMPNIESLDWFLEHVWEDVLIKFPKIKLVLAGKNMPDKFKKRASKNIVVMDQINDSELFYQTYDIMLVPLWSGSGLRIKLVEGFAYGKPIITTSIGAEGISYTNNKNILIADNKKDFANAITTLLSDLEFKKQLQNQARLLAETYFDYKLIGKQLTDFYKTI